MFLCNFSMNKNKSVKLQNFARKHFIRLILLKVHFMRIPMILSAFRYDKFFPRQSLNLIKSAAVGLYEDRWPRSAASEFDTGDYD